MYGIVSVVAIIGRQTVKGDDGGSDVILLWAKDTARQGVLWMEFVMITAIVVVGFLIYQNKNVFVVKIKLEFNNFKFEMHAKEKNGSPRK